MNYIPSETEKELYKLLLSITSNEEYIDGVLTSFNSDVSRRKMIDFIQNVSNKLSDVILYSIDISDEEEIWK